MNVPNCFKTVVDGQEVTVSVTKPGHMDFLETLADLAGCQGVDYPDENSACLQFRYGTDVCRELTGTALSLGFVHNGLEWVRNPILGMLVDAMEDTLPSCGWEGRREIRNLVSTKCNFPTMFEFELDEEEGLAGWVLHQKCDQHFMQPQSWMSNDPSASIGKPRARFYGTFDQVIYRALSYGYVPGGELPNVTFRENPMLLSFME